MIRQIHRSNVIGSANKETIIHLPRGEAFTGLHDKSLRTFQEETFGGSGLCNAVALKKTTTRSYGLNEIMLVSAVGRDPTAQEIEKFLRSQHIGAYLQPQPGQSSEHTTVLLSGVADEPRAILKSSVNGLLARDSFHIDRGVKGAVSGADLVIASSFKSTQVVELARHAKKDGIFAWVLNGESMHGIINNVQVQQEMRKGAIDIVFMSNSETGSSRRAYGHINDVFSGVKILVETMGKDGCRVVFQTCERRDLIEVPALDIVQVPVNDNGAGEAFHSNFLATLIAARNRGLFNEITDIPPPLLQTAAYMGNLAGFLMINTPESLDFPQLDYQLVGEMMELMQSGNYEYNPQSIAKKMHRL